MDSTEIRNEIESRLAANYKYLFLSDRPGDILDKDNCVIHPMNKTWTKNLERDKEKALEFMASNPNPKYPYRLGFCRKVRGACDVVQVTNNGKPVEIENEIVETLNDETMIEPVRTYEGALEDKMKIERLEYMVRERDRKISELEEELEGVVSDLQDSETGQMADNTVSLVSQIAPLLPALADRYFQLQEQKIAAMKGTQSQAQQQPINEEPRTTVYEDYDLQ